MIKAILNAIMNAIKSFGAKLKAAGAWVKKGGKWIYEVTTETVADMVDESLQMADRGLRVLDWCGDRIARLWPFGGGDGGPAEPKKDIGLPEVDEVKTIKTQAREQQEAVGLVYRTPAQQVLGYCKTPKEARETVDLSHLDQAQIEWLFDLSDHDLQVIATASEPRVKDALAGGLGAIQGVKSVGEVDEPKSPLALRIEAFRAGELGLPPTPPALAAYH